MVHTKAHVVDLILDLVGYQPDQALHLSRLLEPSCGEGAFLAAVTERLLLSAAKQGVPAASLSSAVRAYDIDEVHVTRSRQVVESALRRHAVSGTVARDLAHAWVVPGDFLLSASDQLFDYVVGNPPYVRIENLSTGLLTEYRRRYESLTDRADLYVAFIEHGLQLLAAGGALSFICADRWTLNKYGAPLRRLITENYRLGSYIDLHTASPFESEVIAYPSIFVIHRGGTAAVRTVTLATASESECAAVPESLKDGQSRPGITVNTYEKWFRGDEPWTATSPDRLRILRDLETRFLPLEQEGAEVGIGVATGNDKIYIVGEGTGIEPSRLVPLVMRSDIRNGAIHDATRFVINTFGDDGRVVDLRDFPRLAAYLDLNGAEIRRRHVAGKNPKAWFRTIDRVYPELVKTPKLLIPDIAGSNEVVLETGRFHPHHNLYFVASSEWDLEVLGGLLSSIVSLFFVWSYAPKMRGGYLRFQAQYIRRIRVPNVESLSERLADSIRLAFRRRDFQSLDTLALAAYGLEDLPTFDFVDTRR